jgi:hypothetical protein
LHSAPQMLTEIASRNAAMNADEEILVRTFRVQHSSFRCIEAMSVYTCENSPWRFAAFCAKHGDVVTF